MVIGGFIVGIQLTFLGGPKGHFAIMQALHAILLK